VKTNLILYTNTPVFQTLVTLSEVKGYKDFRHSSGYCGFDSPSKLSNDCFMKFTVVRIQSIKMWNS